MADRRPASEKPVGSGKPNRINRLLAARIARDYGTLTNVVMVSNRGLNSEQTGELRAELHSKGVRMRVVRSRISLRAFRDLGVKDAAKLFLGPTAIIDAEDPVLAAKLALEFRDKFKDKLVVIGGLVEGQVLNAEEVDALSRSKSKPEVLAELAGLALGPGARLAAAIRGPGARVAGAIKALVEKLEKEVVVPAPEAAQPAEAAAKPPEAAAKPTEAPKA